MRGGLVSASGFNLAIRSDALFVTTSSEEISEMPASEADASRLRLALEGSRPLEFASRSSLAPSIELGLTVELRAHRLMAHEENSYSQWGVGGWVHLAPRGPAKGFSARLGSSVGATASGVDSLLTRRNTAGLAAGDGVWAGGCIGAEVGYAVGAFGGNGVVTPYGGFFSSGGGGETYRAGWRISLGESFSLSLEGDRRESVNASPEHGMVLRGSLRW